MDHELPTLMEEVEQIQQQYYLCEGIFSNLKNRAKTFFTSIKKAVMKFIDKVILRVIGNLKTLAQKGVSTLMDALGLEFSGNVAMSSPTW
jgi:molecular chaperone GrpE (heat shock protein)